MMSHARLVGIDAYAEHPQRGLGRLLLAQVDEERRALPRPECRTMLGQVACGYNCVSVLGQVRCAQTPVGVCAASTTKVQCFDPPWQVYARYGLAAPAPQCLANVEQIACGYACTSTIKDLRCAQTPAGRCQRFDGQVTCWDPLLPIPYMGQTGG